MSPELDVPTGAGRSCRGGEADAHWPSFRYHPPVDVTEVPEAAEGADVEGLRRRLRYYGECVREDAGAAVQLDLEDQGRTWAALKLAREWALDGSADVGFEFAGPAGSFADLAHRRRRDGLVFYGYPLCLAPAKSDRDETAGWVPIFLLPVDVRRHGGSVVLSLSGEAWPRLNPRYAELFYKKREIRRALLDQLGLLDPGPSGPAPLAELVRRFAELDPWGEAVEPLEPDRLVDAAAPVEVGRAGLYNRAVVLVGEPSPYTRGLLSDLAELDTELSESTVVGTALRAFSDNPGPDEVCDEPVVEVVPLNDEQREAVRSAFEAPLTVVTGPPGTGKSQVVVSVLANAFLRGERVLFASRNNRAVDVIESRVNALASQPVIVRAGRRSGPRDLRAILLHTLTRLLSTRADDSDRDAHLEAVRRVAALEDEREAVWQRLEQVRELRNLVTDLDRRLASARDSLTPEFWAACARLHAPPAELPLAEAAEIVGAWLQPDAGALVALRRRVTGRSQVARVAALCDEIGALGALMPPLPGVEPEQAEALLEGLAECRRRLDVLGLWFEFRALTAQLAEAVPPEALAEQLAQVDGKRAAWGARLLEAASRLVPDRLDDAARRQVGRYRATLERLENDELGPRARGRLRIELDSLLEDLTAVLPVWCVTNLAVRGALPLRGALFDLVVVDEAGQCDIASALPLMYRARRAMIIGDAHQLRHIASVDRQQEQVLQLRHGLEAAAEQPWTFAHNSLFDLATTHALGPRMQLLVEHFRSHADIIGFSNQQWYGGQLVVCTEYARLVVPQASGPGVRWIPVSGRASRPASGGASHATEARVVVDELDRLLTGGGFTGTVGVVTPFRAQANAIRKAVARRLDPQLCDRARLLIDTAHGFQGDERDVIVLSPCVAPGMPRGARHFLAGSGNLFNVAITRARASLVVVGDPAACAASGIPHLEAFATWSAARSVELTHDPSRDHDAAVGPWERPLMLALREAGLEPVPQYVVDQYRLDLAILQGTTPLNIEVDGALYHRDWDGARARRDVMRDRRLQERGWRVKRFWVHEVRDDLERCVRQIRELVDRETAGGAR